MEYPVQRNLDDILFRITRKGKWCKVCVTDLTEEERIKCLQSQNDFQLLWLANHLANILRSIGDEHDISHEICDDVV